MTIFITATKRFMTTTTATIIIVIRSITTMRTAEGMIMIRMFLLAIIAMPLNLDPKRETPNTQLVLTVNTKA